MNKQLQLLQSELNKNYSELLEIECNRVIADLEFSFESNLELKDKNRSCKIYPFDNEQSLKYVFEWDDCPIFEISSADIKRQGEIIINWILKKSMPTVMQTQFPEIELSELAKYYEKGEGIKGEFIESWNLLEESFNSELSIEPTHFIKDAIRLIKEMRSQKLDESLRVGTRLSILIFSRARRHIVNEKTSHISVVFLGNNFMKLSSHFKNKTKSIKREVKYDNYFKSIVTELLKEKIE